MGTPTGGQSRRTVLKTLAAGTALSSLGVTVVGAQEGDDGGDGGRTVHRVQTLIAPPSNPERPADFYFQPTGLHVESGDVLAFEFVTPAHNVVAYHPAFGMRRRVPLGVEAFSSPLLGWKPSSIPGDQVEPPSLPSEAAGDEGGDGAADQDAGDGPVPDQFLLSPTTPGVYDLLCSPHEGFGMVMRVVVGDQTDAEFETGDATALPPPRAGPVDLAREVLTDPALAPERIVEAGTVSWADLEANQVSSSGGESDED